MCYVLNIFSPELLHSVMRPGDTVCSVGMVNETHTVVDEVVYVYIYTRR